MMWLLNLVIFLVFLPIILGIMTQATDSRKKAAQRTAAAREAAAKAEENRRRAYEAAREAEEKASAATAKKAEQARRKAEREAEQQKKRAEKLEAARQLAEYKERALQAEKELQSIRKRSAAPAQEKPAAVHPAPDPVQPDPVPVNAGKSFPQTLAGEVIAFTGSIPTMTRADAIKETARRGGKAYDSIHADCTLLVIGQRPGQQQQERAAKWNIRTVTWEEFFSLAQISLRRRQHMLAMAAENGWKRPA